MAYTKKFCIQKFVLPHVAFLNRFFSLSTRVSVCLKARFFSILASCPLVSAECNFLKTQQFKNATCGNMKRQTFKSDDVTGQKAGLQKLVIFDTIQRFENKGKVSQKSGKSLIQFQLDSTSIRQAFDLFSALSTKSQTRSNRPNIRSTDFKWAFCLFVCFFF